MQFALYNIRIWSPVLALVAYKVQYFIGLISFTFLLYFNLQIIVVYICRGQYDISICIYII